MIMDAQNLFSTAQVFTATAVSTNVIDLGVDRDVGIGRSLEIDARVVVAYAGGTSLQVQVQTATDAAFTSPLVVDAGPVVPLASLVVGFEPGRLRLASPTLRYVRLNYVVVGTMSGGGAISAALVVNRQANRAYPSGIPAQA